MIRKDVLVAILAIFCLTVTLFLIIPTRSQSQSPTGTYDPWVDLNDDGQINILDAIILSNCFGTSGTPINKTAWLDLQSQMNALNITIPEVEQVLEIINYSNWYNGLIGYWKFDEGNGTVANDSSGNNNNGVLVNGPVWVSGKYGTALSFNGVDEYVNISQSSRLDIVDSASITAWIYPTSLAGYATILSRWYGGTSSRGIVLQLEQGSAVRFGVIDDHNYFDSPFSFEINNWYYIAATWNGSFSRVYVNGMEIRNMSTSGNFTNQNVDLEIGCDLTPTPAYFFNGTIDNVMLYNRTLSAEEVMAHYLLPPP